MDIWLLQTLMTENTT